jgi:hypothetical protein
MQQFDFGSRISLTQIGSDLRDHLADTFDEPVEMVFGALLNALDHAEGALCLAPNNYQWSSTAAAFAHAGSGN